jgi:hypothetical protein
MHGPDGLVNVARDVEDGVEGHGSAGLSIESEALSTKSVEARSLVRINVLSVDWTGRQALPLSITIEESFLNGFR